MLAIAYTEINALALVILFLLFANIYRRGESHLVEQKLFLALLASNAAAMIFDTAQWLLNGQPGAGYRNAALIVATVYCALTPLPCLCWSAYANYQVNRDENKIRKLALPLLAPVAVNAVFAVLSSRMGYVFEIDRNNVYHRGPLFILMAVICYSYLIYPVFYALTNKNTLLRKTYVSLLLFAIPPFVGGMIQSLFYGISLVWPCMTVSILIIFINLQNSQLYTHHLTGLYNRKEMDSYLQEWTKKGGAGELMAGIMLDLNSFKKINDRWGHDAGDQALIDAGKLLGASFRKDDLICRYGGDEFVVIAKIRQKSDLIHAVERLRGNTDQFNRTSGAPYTISFSIGYDVYDRSSGMTSQQFLKRIDNLMYEDKKASYSYFKNKAE